jgi:hypothetical protein
MTKPFLAAMLATGFLVSCNAAAPDTSGAYECVVTCSIQGVEMSTSAPFAEMAASNMDAVAACESNAQTRVANICGNATATVACICDLPP